MYTTMDGTKLATWPYYELYVQQVYELHTVYNNINDYVLTHCTCTLLNVYVVLYTHVLVP